MPTQFPVLDQQTAPIPASISAVVFFSQNMAVTSMSAPVGIHTALVAVQRTAPTLERRTNLVSYSVAETTGGADIFLVTLLVNPVLSAPLVFNPVVGSDRMLFAVGTGAEAITDPGLTALSDYHAGTAQSFTAIGVELDSFLIPPTPNTVVLAVQSSGVASFLGALSWVEFA